MKNSIIWVVVLLLAGCGGTRFPQIVAQTPGSVTVQGVHGALTKTPGLEQAMANLAQTHCAMQNKNAVLTIDAPTADGWILNNTYECR